MSVPGHRPDQTANLPLHFPPLNVTTRTETIAGTAQKSILIDERILLQWAGSQMFGEAVARAIHDDLQAGRAPDLEAILTNPDMGADAQQDSALILNMLATNNLVMRFELRARKADSDQTLFAGTGAFDFFDDVRIEHTPKGSAGQKALDRWYTRLAMVLAEEFYFRAPLDYAYGGWHEIIRDTPVGFAKAPYLVKFWALEGDVLTSGPVFTSWYVDQHLCIFGGPGGEVPGSNAKLVIVPAWNRDPIDGAKAMVGFDQPYLQFHFVQQGGGVKFFFENNPWPGGFTVTLADGKFRFELGQAFIDKIRSNEGYAATLSRHSDDDF